MSEQTLHTTHPPQHTRPKRAPPNPPRHRMNRSRIPTEKVRLISTVLSLTTPTNSRYFQSTHTLIHEYSHPKGGE